MARLPTGYGTSDEQIGIHAFALRCLPVDVPRTPDGPVSRSLLPPATKERPAPVTNNEHALACEQGRSRSPSLPRSIRERE